MIGKSAPLKCSSSMMNPRLGGFCAPACRRKGITSVRRKTAPPGLIICGAPRLTSSSWISGCPTSTGSTSSSVFAVRARRCRSWCCRARADEPGKAKALNLGADDCVTKPFGIDELLARIRAGLRHRLQQEGEQPLFRCGGLPMGPVRRIVTVGGHEVHLTPREYDLLRLFVAHAGKVLTHRFILREVWGGEGDVQYLRVYIRALRHKIEPDPEQPRHILTEQGVGYRMRAPN